MARTRKVDSEQAGQAAVSAFWRYGYHALGTRQLETETGITRFTLQTTYGGKKALFDQAVDSYLNDMEGTMLPAMIDGSLDGIAKWFEMRCDESILPPEGAYGCLVINSLVEFSGTDAVMNAQRDRFFAMLTRAFDTALQQAKAAGELPDSFDIEAHTSVLLAGSIGLNVAICAAASPSGGQLIANSLATMVRGWKT